MHRPVVVVCGANGLLGANVCKCLYNHHFHVKALVRKDSNTRAIEDLKLEIIETDITRYEELEKVIQDSQYVVNCAADTKQFPNTLSGYLRVNVDLVHNLIHICKKKNIKRFIHVSSTNCFTNGSMERPGTEDGGFMQWMKDSGYAYSKLLAQEMVLKEAEHGRLDAVIVAPSFIIGERDARLSSGRLLLHGLKNRVVFYPPGGKSFVDADSVSEAISHALLLNKPDAMYLLAGNNLTYKSFFKKVSKISGKKQILLPIPASVLKFAAYLSDLFRKVFQLSVPLTKVNQRLLCLDNYFSSEKAHIQLDFQRTEIDRTIEKAIRWFRTNGYV